MYELFFQKLNEKVSFTEEEQDIIRSYLTPKKIRKRQYPKRNKTSSGVT
jgi:hypothetical protein